MAVGAILGLLSAAIPYIPRVLQFLKAGAQFGVPIIIKGAMKARELAERAGVALGALKVGLETAKQVPYIGEQIKKFVEKPEIQKAVERAEGIIRSTGNYASLVEKGTPEFVGKFISPLEVR